MDIARAVKVFKPFIVKRSGGGCQVLFPLSMLDELLEQAFRAGIIVPKLANDGSGK